MRTTYGWGSSHQIESSERKGQPMLKNIRVNPNVGQIRFYETHQPAKFCRAISHQKLGYRNMLVAAYGPVPQILFHQISKEEWFEVLLTWKCLGWIKSSKLYYLREYAWQVGYAVDRLHQQGPQNTWNQGWRSIQTWGRARWDDKLEKQHPIRTPWKIQRVWWCDKSKIIRKKHIVMTPLAGLNTYSDNITEHAT